MREKEKRMEEGSRRGKPAAARKRNCGCVSKRLGYRFFKTFYGQLSINFELQSVLEASQ